MLASWVPGSLVRTFAKPYLAGGSIEAALEAAAAAWKHRGMLSTLDLLGEAVLRPEQVAHNEQTYHEVLDALATDPRFSQEPRPTVSLKPSAFCLEGAEDRNQAFAVIERVLERARARSVGVTIDMEDRSWTETTVQNSVGLFQRGFDVGTVLQTRLHRTKEDLVRIPSGMRVRLVIGIYPEPAEVALTDKTAMKERLLEHALTLLQRGARVEFATHDDVFVERFVKEIAPDFPGQCELQLLLGVPRDRMLARLKEDPVGAQLPVRLYVPFSTDMKEATAYLRRRLQESPGMVWHVLRNFGGG